MPGNPKKCGRITEEGKLKFGINTNAAVEAVQIFHIWRAVNPQVLSESSLIEFGIRFRCIIDDNCLIYCFVLIIAGFPADSVTRTPWQQANQE